MKKLNLGWMLALTFVMVVGLAACAPSEEPQGTMDCTELGAPERR